MVRTARATATRPQQAANLLGRPLRDLGLITCHLGNGGSITAVNHGKSHRHDDGLHARSRA